MRHFSLLSLVFGLACTVQAPTAPNGPSLPGRADAGPSSDAGSTTPDATAPRDAGSPECAADRFEPNDTIEASAEARPGEFIQNLTACPGNEDWFYIQLEEDQRVRFEIDHDRQGDIDMTVLNAEGESLAGLERSADNILSAWVEDQRKVFVRITNPSRRVSVYGLTVELAAVECPSDDYEDNNNANDASRITGGRFDDLTSCGEPDFYRLTLDEGQRLEATLEGSEDLLLELIDGDGDSVLRAGSPSGEGRSLVFTAVNAGVYFIRVTGQNDYEGPYDLILERAIEGNNTCAQAQTVALPRNEAVEITGSTRGFDNNYEHECGHPDNGRTRAPERVYALVVPEGGGTLQVWMRGETDGFDPVLALRRSCDDAESEIACNDDHSPRDRDEARLDSRLREEVEAGTYYLFADGFRTTSGEFELSMFLEWEEPETGPACETAQAIELTREERLVVPVNNERGQRQYAPRTCAERSGEQGRERAYTFTVAETSLFTAYTAHAEGGRSYDTVLYLLRGCGGLDEIACHDDIGRDNKLSRLSDERLAPGTYTIVADGFYDRDVGSVNLVLELAAP